jgi:hypothetical protein
MRRKILFNKKPIVLPLHDVLWNHFSLLKIQGLVREHRFHPKRRWRIDIADVERKIAMECEGGTYSNGRHTRGVGFENDCEKYNNAVLLGWRILRFTRKIIESGHAVNYYLDMI